jgi:hypothetical protein
MRNGRWIWAVLVLVGCGGMPCTEGLDEALGEMSVVASFCRPGLSTLAVDGDGRVLDVLVTTEGSDATFTLSGWEPELEQADPEVSNVAAPTLSEMVLVFGGSYLELNGGRAIYGYTTSGDGAPGEVFVVSTADGSVTRMDAPGNFDAAWLDGTRFALSGLGLTDRTDGQGIYVADVSTSPPTVARVASGPGDFSGSIAVTSEYVLVGGTIDVTFENVVYVISRADFDAALSAGETIAIGTDERAVLVTGSGAEPLSTTFALVDGRFVSLPYTGAITAYDVAFDGTSLTLSSPEVLGMAPTFKAAVSAGSGQLYLLHDNGVILVE